jgi:NTE family protein
MRRPGGAGVAAGAGRPQGIRLLAATAALLAVAAAGPAAAGPATACQGRGDRGAPSLRLGVVLGGGGAKAAYEAGVGLALAERGIAPTVVAGTSAGAINAVLIATGDTERLAGLWRTIRREDVYTYRAPAVLGGLLPGWLALRVLAGSRGLLDPSPLRATLARHVDLARLREAPVGILVVAADLMSGKARRFDNASLTLDALMASATVPGLFPAVASGAELLVDGGVVQRAPVLELLEAWRLDRLVVVLGYESPSPPDASLQAVVERAVELSLSREVLRDVELARLRHPGVDVQVLRPSAPLAVRPLDFDGARLGALVDRGREDGQRCLDALGYAP